MKNFSEFLQEALDPKHIEQVQQWINGIGGKELAAKAISQHVFKDKDTLIHPLNEDHVEIPIHPEVKDHLEKFGYKIPSSAEYHAGYAVDKYNRITSIGKALKRTKAEPSVVGAFENDPNRAASNKKKLAIAYTWEPKHVASMSTGRGWTSCMNMDEGMNRHYLEHDIAHGTHVAYLIHDDDHKIDSPLARIALKPFKSEDGEHTILRPETTTYGTAKDSFGQHVSDWAETHFPAKPDVEYRKPNDLYNDSYSTYIKHRPETIKSAVDDLMSPSTISSYASPHKRILRQLRTQDDLHIAVTHALSHPSPIEAVAGATNIADIAEHVPESPKTTEMLTQHIIKHNIHTPDAISYANRYANHLSNDSVNQFAEHMMKAHNMTEPSYGMVSHAGLTPENLDKLIAKNPATLENIPVSKVTKPMVNMMHERVNASDDFETQGYHNYNGILASKHFEAADIDKAVASNIAPKMTDGHTSNISMLIKRLHTNPNYTIDVARNLDKKYSALSKIHFALGHVDATAEDANNSILKHEAGIQLDARNIRGIKNPRAYDHIFEQHPELIYSNHKSWLEPTSNKYGHFIVASSGDVSDDKEMNKKILDTVTMQNMPFKNPDSNAATRAKRGVISYLKAAVYANRNKPEMHQHIHNAIENAANSGDVTMAHSLIHESGEMPIKSSTLDLVNRKSEQQSYNTVRLNYGKKVING